MDKLKSAYENGPDIKKIAGHMGKIYEKKDFRRKELMEWVAKIGVDIIRLPDRFIAHHSPVSTIIQSMSVSYIMNLDTLWVPFNSIIQFRYVVLAIVFIESPAFKSLIFSFFLKIYRSTRSSPSPNQNRRNSQPEAERENRQQQRLFPVIFAPDT